MPSGGSCCQRKVVQVRIANIDWSSVYLIESDEGRVVVYVDKTGAQASAPSAVLEAKDAAAALKAAQEDPRFQRAGEYWIDRRRLRHTRSGSTALLSFALSGGRIATVQVPAEVLQQLKPNPRTGTSHRKSSGRAKAELVGAGA